MNLTDDNRARWWWSCDRCDYRCSDISESKLLDLRQQHLSSHVTEDYA